MAVFVLIAFRKSCLVYVGSVPWIALGLSLLNMGTSIVSSLSLWQKVFEMIKLLNDIVLGVSCCLIILRFQLSEKVKWFCRHLFGLLIV